MSEVDYKILLKKGMKKKGKKDANYFLVLKKNRAAVWLHHSHHHIESSRFAGAVRAQQSHHFAGCHVNRNAIHHHAVAVSLHQFVGMKQLVAESGGRGNAGSWLVHRGISWCHAHLSNIKQGGLNLRVNASSNDWFPEPERRRSL